MFDDEGCDLDRVFSWVASLVNPLPDQRIRVALGAGYSRATALLPNIVYCRCQSVSSQCIVAAPPPPVDRPVILALLEYCRACRTVGYLVCPPKAMALPGHHTLDYP